MPYETCWACNKYVSSLVFVCGTLFCYVNFETVCELCWHSWLPNICVYGLYLCCKGNEFYILCWAVYVSMCVHLAISSNFRILGTHSCVHLAITSNYICLIMIDFAKHMKNFSKKNLCLETKHGPSSRARSIGRMMTSFKWRPVPSAASPMKHKSCGAGTRRARFSTRLQRPS